MATQSILKNITITDFDDAEMLISAMERAMKNADDSKSQFKSHKHFVPHIKGCLV